MDLHLGSAGQNGKLRRGHNYMAIHCAPIVDHPIDGTMAACTNGLIE